MCAPRFHFASRDAPDCEDRADSKVDRLARELATDAGGIRRELTLEPDFKLVS
jgi:hypothetical protein